MRTLTRDYMQLFLGQNTHGTRFPEWWFKCQDNTLLKDAYDTKDWDLIEDLICLASEVLGEE